MRWTVLVPLKALPAAKSRLVPGMSVPEHAALVEAIRADTLVAVRGAASVARVVVVTDVPSAFDVDVVIVQTEPGLNAGLAEAAAQAAHRWPEDGIAALVGDLPALLSSDLDAALDAAARNPRSFVPDSPGTGTTLLAASPGNALDPQFGTDSASRHKAGAAELAAGATLRADVDTAEDLRRAAELGLGARTELIARSSSPGKMRL